MEFVSILGILSGILIGLIVVGLGVLIGKHQSVIRHFKKSAVNSTDPLDDLENEVNKQSQDFFTNLGNVMATSFKLLGGGGVLPANDKDDKLQGMIIFIGQALIIIGYITIITALISGLYILSMSGRNQFGF
jgi:hypothetical protein